MLSHITPVKREWAAFQSQQAAKRDNKRKDPGVAPAAAETSTRTDRKPALPSRAVSDRPSIEESAQDFNLSFRETRAEKAAKKGQRVGDSGPTCILNALTCVFPQNVDEDGEYVDEPKKPRAKRSKPAAVGSVWFVIGFRPLLTILPDSPFSRCPGFSSNPEKRPTAPCSARHP